MAVRVLSFVLLVLLIFTVAVTTARRRGMWTARNRGTARIIDRKPAEVGQFPHQAYIFAEQVNSSRTKSCAGSLITRDVVLTSAFCVYGYQRWTIRLGGIHRKEPEKTAWTAVSPWALVHPEYKGNTGYNDVAIIFLVHDAPLSFYIKVATLPSSLEADTNYLLERGVVSGWGYTTRDNGKLKEVLHWTEVKVIPMDICKKFYESYNMTDKLCATNENVGGSWGDDGTGLLLRTDYGFKQIGILAHHGGNRLHNKTRPAVYTRVASYIDWISTEVPISNCSVAN